MGETAEVVIERWVRDCQPRPGNPGVVGLRFGVSRLRGSEALNGRSRPAEGGTELQTPARCVPGSYCFTLVRRRGSGANFAVLSAVIYYFALGLNETA